MIGIILAFIFGSIVGSFLNVCIHRMPKGESVVWPRSHCPHCNTRIPGYDNIPFLSYILLGGRCRTCKKKISLRYPLVELLTALSFVALFNHYRVSYDLFFYIVLFCCLIIATFTDIKLRLIPSEVTLGGMIVGFILSTIKGIHFMPLAFSFEPMLNSFRGIIIGGGIIYATGFLFDLVWFKLLKKPPIQGETKSMQWGDVEFLAMIGAFLGWQKALLTFFVAPFLGVIVGLPNLILKKDHLLPYCPFLALAAVLALFWSDKILRLAFSFLR